MTSETQSLFGSELHCCISCRSNWYGSGDQEYWHARDDFITVEADGRLPTGETLGEAIEEVDAATDGYASYFMINCAHPDHFGNVLSDEPWAQRLRGVMANASRCSHAELDEAKELDGGDPVELGQQPAEIQGKHSQISILGGCCGTDMRHLNQIAKSAKTT